MLLPRCGCLVEEANWAGWRRLAGFASELAAPAVRATAAAKAADEDEAELAWDEERGSWLELGFWLRLLVLLAEMEAACGCVVCNWLGFVAGPEFG